MFSKLVCPHQVLAELKKSNFTLLNQSVTFDENGDPNYGSYSIVFWNQSGDAQEIGFHNFYPNLYFFIDNSKIQWKTKEVSCFYPLKYFILFYFPASAGMCVCG